VAAIVGSHGGSVRVEKTDGGGATLVVSLPHRDEALPADAADGHEAADGRTGQRATGSGGSVIHI
jgi:two-component system OmpR family sensor kinase